MKNYFKTLVMALPIIIFCNCCNDDDNNTAKSACEGADPSGLLTYAEADQMEETFKSTQYAVISEYFAANNDGEFIDNREFWFPLEDLKCYFEYVENNASEAGYSISEMGIRLYLGAKQENDENTPVTKIIFVPTAGSSDSRLASPVDDTFYGAAPKDYGSSGRPPKDLEPE